jgi:hypothetical protein
MKGKQTNEEEEIKGIKMKEKKLAGERVIISG